MSSSFRSLSEILAYSLDLSENLIDADRYWAHTPRQTGAKKMPETLTEHVNLVNQYLAHLVSNHRLDLVIDNLIQGLSTHLDAEKANYIKSLFVNIIVYHDFGKINELFQVNKMNNPDFKGKDFEISPLGSTHSALGAFIYLSVHLDEIIKEKSQDHLLIAVCLCLSYSIFKHHSKKLDDEYLYTISLAELSATNSKDQLRSFMIRYLQKYRFNIDPRILKLIANKDFANAPYFKVYMNSFDLYALCRLNFSLLTAADYLATNEYMNGIRISDDADSGILTKDRIEQLYTYVSNSSWLGEKDKKPNYNKQVYELIKDYQLQNPREKSNSSLNILRQEMAIQVIRNIQTHYQSNLFYIEAPTGGGKTNLSLLATVELLKLYDGQYNKVYYVFPFTTLITQTYAYIREMLALDEDEIIELHSRASFKENMASDDLYGSEQLNYINNLFVHYPFCLLTHIHFFDILKTNEKEANYLLHRLANSIVVIDELQSYNPDHWDKMIYFIRQYAEKFNIKFILMSATLPKLDKLKVIEEQVRGFIYLLPDAKERYFNNPNFSERIQFRFDLLERKALSLEELAAAVIDASKKYASYDFGRAKPEGSVYTIVEFIYKRSATAFCDIINRHGYFDQVFVLSGTILEHRRKEIIRHLKEPSNRRKKVILITTQVVEAGVDIDMDIGYKDRSLIDSDEQLAGRINRNLNKAHCVLYLFNYDKASAIYGKDKRFKITNEVIDAAEYQRILKEKDFDALYNLVVDGKNALNETELISNFTDYEKYVRKLQFSSVHEKFKLIEQQNITCFIPVDICLNSKDKTDTPILTHAQLRFLEINGIVPDETGSISGEQVFDLYLEFIQNKEEIMQQQIRVKQLQSVMSMFTISLFSTVNMMEKLAVFSHFEKSQFGYHYIHRWRDIYSIECGLDANKLDGIEESQFL